MNYVQAASQLNFQKVTVSLEELAQICTLSIIELDELMEYGALVPMPSPAQRHSFSADWIMPLRTVGCLRVDFDLDLFNVAMVLGYLQRIDQREWQLHTLTAQLDARDERPQSIDHQDPATRASGSLTNSPFSPVRWGLISLPFKLHLSRPPRPYPVRYRDLMTPERGAKAQFSFHMKNHPLALVGIALATINCIAK